MENAGSMENAVSVENAESRFYRLVVYTYSQERPRSHFGQNHKQFFSIEIVKKLKFIEFFLCISAYVG